MRNRIRVIATASIITTVGTCRNVTTIGRRNHPVTLGTSSVDGNKTSVADTAPNTVCTSRCTTKAGTNHFTRRSRMHGCSGFSMTACVHAFGQRVHATSTTGRLLLEPPQFKSKNITSKRRPTWLQLRQDSRILYSRGLDLRNPK
ncbi:unnamed protein product [Prorocentrum cordatum]|uniref:Secreted protein n=1 Tax=Prorocentrum cordatum TaxID=2364126 RepID=A0ABN9RJI1_9DINO|nr:unnamed protein product [Polarella glacialis]